MLKQLQYVFAFRCPRRMSRGLAWRAGSPAWRPRRLRWRKSQRNLTIVTKLTFCLKVESLFRLLQSISEILRMRDSYTNPYETKRIESFEIFGLTKQIHKTNLTKIVSQNESFEHRRTKRIHETNLLNTVGRNESRKRIFWKAEGFANP